MDDNPLRKRTARRDRVAIATVIAAVVTAIAMIADDWLSPLHLSRAPEAAPAGPIQPEPRSDVHDDSLGRDAIASTDAAPEPTPGREEAERRSAGDRPEADGPDTLDLNGVWAVDVVLREQLIGGGTSDPDRYDRYRDAELAITHRGSALHGVFGRVPAMHRCAAGPFRDGTVDGDAVTWRVPCDGSCAGAELRFRGRVARADSGELTLRGRLVPHRLPRSSDCRLRVATLSASRP